MAKKVKHSMFVQVRDFNGDYHRQLRECAKILKSELGQAPDMSQTARVVAQRFPTMSDEIERLKVERDEWKAIAMKYAPDKEVFEA